MPETKVCGYCNNEIRPLDNHAAAIKSSGDIIKVNGSRTQMQEVTCVLTRSMIVTVEPTK